MKDAIKPNLMQTLEVYTFAQLHHFYEYIATTTSLILFNIGADFRTVVYGREIK